jgi:TM2 domain-containing membrane protein YozV
MNCANHPEVTAAAYCRTCGKALCENCKREIRGVIYCEPCIAARLVDAVPTAPPPPAQPVVVSSGGPNPALAGVLAGFLPFGVGQAYTGQYSKALAHMFIFIALIWIAKQADIFGIAVFAFWIYQIIDAVRSAKHIQQGLPAPDPFGLGAMFGGRSAQVAPPPSSATYPSAHPSSGSYTAAQPSSGTYAAAQPPSGTYGAAVPPSGSYATAPSSGGYPAAGPSEHVEHGAPMGPILLIVIGILILLTNLGDLHWYRWAVYSPVILIVLGVWHGWRRLTFTNCQCVRCRSNCLTGPVVVITLGVLFLLANLGIAAFGHTWPILLIIVGLGVIFKHNAPTTGHVDANQPPFTPPPGPPPATPPSSGSTGTAQLMGSSTDRQNG